MYIQLTYAKNIIIVLNSHAEYSDSAILFAYTRYGTGLQKGA